MEGEHGQKAKEKRRKFFSRQRRGLDTNYNGSSTRSDIESFSMFSDSESSDSDSEETLGITKKNTTRKNSEGVVKNIFSQAPRRSFFPKNDSKVRAKEWDIIILHWDDEVEETRELVHQRVR